MSQWIKKDDKADRGTSVWIEHVSNRWRIAACRVKGKRVYPLFQKAINQKYWTIYGIYESSDDAILAQRENLPNRKTA